MHITLVLLVLIAFCSIGISSVYADPSTNETVNAVSQTAPNNKDTSVQAKPAVQKAGWVKDADGSWYYYAKPNSKPKTGWLKSGGAWYWLQPDKGGAMASNTWIEDGGNSYYLTKSGAMKTGWLKYKGGWYYLKSSGAKAIGWQKSGNKWYWLQPGKDGLMAENQWVKDGKKYYYLAKSGAMKTGWLKYKKDWYYLKSSGYRATGWQKVKGAWYYLQKNGVMLSGGPHKIDGKEYTFQESGAWAPYSGDAVVDAWLDAKARSLGSLKACYDWLVSLRHINWAGEDLRYAAGSVPISDKWVVYELKRLMNGKPIDCYGKAAGMAGLAKALGYESYAVSGYVKTRTRWASHGWAEVVKNGKLKVYDAPFGRSHPRVKFYDFTYDNAPANYKKY